MMKKLATIFVITGTAFLFAPAAFAGQYSDAINSCKAAISDRVSGDRVNAALGNVKQKNGSKVQLDFRIRVSNNGETVSKRARCLTTRDGEVLSLTIS
jgi:hypothetical protein